MENLELPIVLNQILAALQHLQQENAMLRDSVNHLQDQPQPLAPTPTTLAMVALEPKQSTKEI
jgi:hypothetical protein